MDVGDVQQPGWRHEGLPASEFAAESGNKGNTGISIVEMERSLDKRETDVKLARKSRVYKP